MTPGELNAIIADANAVLYRLLFALTPGNIRLNRIIRVVSDTPEARDISFSAARMLVEKMPYSAAQLAVNPRTREIWRKDGGGVVRYVLLDSKDGRAAQLLVRDDISCE